MAHHHHHHRRHQHQHQHQHPKSPKSPLTREWLAMMEGDDNTDNDDTDNDDEPAIADHRRAAGTRSAQPVPPQLPAALNLVKSQSHDNRSWWSFVTESPSEELEAMSGFVGTATTATPHPKSGTAAAEAAAAASRKVRFDKSVPKSAQPPPILKTSSSYGGGGGGGNGNSHNNSQSGNNVAASSLCTSVQKYHSRDLSSNNNKADAESLLDFLQDRLISSSCGGVSGVGPTPTTRAAEDFFHAWERRLEKLWGNDDYDYDDDPAHLRSFSDDTFSDASGNPHHTANHNPRRSSAPAQLSSSYSSRHHGVASPAQSPTSTEGSQSFDELFLSRDDHDEPILQPTKSHDGGQSTGSSKYKDMLKRSKKMVQRRGTPVPAGGGGLPKKGSAFAPFLPSPAIKSHTAPTPVRSNRTTKTTQQQSKPQQLSERNRASTPVEEDQHSNGSRRRMLDVKYRLLKTSLQQQSDERTTVAIAPVAEATDEERSTKENGRPPSRGTRSSTSSSSREQHPLPAPAAVVAATPPRTMPPETYQQPCPDSRQSHQGGAAWVAAPAVVSGLSEESSGQNRAQPAPLSLLPEDGPSRMCLPPVLQQRFRRRRQRSRSVPVRSRDHPPTTIEAIPHVVSQLDEIHNNDVGEVPVPQKDKQQSSGGSSSSHRHAYVAYFHRGSARAGKTIRLYEHAAPAQFPTLESEVVVQVLASTVSETDCKIRTNVYWADGHTQHPLDVPVVPGTAFCGTIGQLDKAAVRSGWKLGDPVVSIVRVGANARHLCISHERLVPVPRTIRDPAAAVCLPEVYLAAFQALHMEQRVGVRYRKNALDGKSILVLGGTTKIGRALIELAALAGSGSVYATAKDKQFKLIEDAGGVPLDRDPHHWYSLLVGKMDLVVCVDCEDMKTSELKYEHIQTLTRHGKIILLNGPEYQGEKVVELNKVDDHSRGTMRRLHHYNVFESWEADMRLGKRDLEHLLKLLSEGLIVPKIFERIPLTKVPRAQEVIQKRPLSGFIVCEPWLQDSSQANQPSSSSRNR